MQGSPLEIRSERQGETGRVTVVGEIDIATAPQVQDAVEAMLAERVGELLIDLRDLAFIDSSGLRLLIALNNRATADGWKLSLTRPSDRSMSVFQITGADENLPFVEEPSTQ
ncbi:MAG TPA: STAS domain-containing protein [Solirubrobacteraceae bacterium]|jgi:anti-anti-sigma factor